MVNSKNDNLHTYEYDVDLNGETASAKVIRMVGQNKRVLEIGAGPGSITKHLKHNGCCNITALEIDTAAIEKLNPYCDRVYQMDLNDVAWPDALVNEDAYDVIVAADVLEHLFDPWATIKAMTSLLNHNGYIILSLPHVGHNAVIACLLNEDFDYHDWGLLDRTHIRFFGLKNIQTLFENANLKIVEAQHVITPPEDSELSFHWNNLQLETQRVLSTNPFGSIYQIVIKAVPYKMPGKAINLMSIKVKAQSAKSNSPHYLINQVKAIAQKYLSPQVRSKISGIIKSLGINI